MVLKRRQEHNTEQMERILKEGREEHNEQCEALLKEVTNFIRLYQEKSLDSWVSQTAKFSLRFSHFKFRMPKQKPLLILSRLQLMRKRQGYIKL